MYTSRGDGLVVCSLPMKPKILGSNPRPGIFLKKNKKENKVYYSIYLPSKKYRHHLTPFSKVFTRLLSSTDCLCKMVISCLSFRISCWRYL